MRAAFVVIFTKIGEFTFIFNALSKLYKAEGQQIHHNIPKLDEYKPNSIKLNIKTPV